MYRDLRVLVVVPARCGSKCIPLDNLRAIGSVLMASRVGCVCRELDWPDWAIVLTNHDEIARAAEEGGLDARFRRTESLTISEIDTEQMFIECDSR